tara:strand:- start:268 stop:507 length:240 start_codon:yes stop_codon:yes gene_type:complete
MKIYIVKWFDYTSDGCSSEQYLNKGFTSKKEAISFKRKLEKGELDNEYGCEHGADLELYDIPISKKGILFAINHFNQTT